MSTVKTNNVQVGQSGTATNNFTLYQPTVPDGTVRLGNGNSGATTSDVITATSAGNVGIGTSSPQTRLHVLDALSGGQLIVANSETNSTEKYGTFATQHYTNAQSPALGMAVQSNITDNNILIGGALGEFNAATQIRFFTAANNTTTTGTERARIDSNGNLLVGTTSTSGVQLATAGGLVTNGIENFWLSRSVSGGSTMNVGRTSGAGTGTLVEWTYNGGVRGSVTTNGTNVAYNTSSDYRLKHDITPMTGALAKVAALKPVTYKWNVDNSAGEGFIAHELQAVVPDAVTGEKDAVDAEGKPVYQGIDTSFLVATLTAAIQELNAKVEALEAKLAQTGA